MSKNYYIPGENNLTCDVCSKKIKSHEARMRWDGFLVCKDDFETRHPQDFVKAQRDKITVPIVRPIPTIQFSDSSMVTLVGSSKVQSTGTTALIQKPIGTQQGDRMFIVCFGATPANITSSFVRETIPNLSTNVRVYSKVMTSTEPAAYLITISSGKFSAIAFTIRNNSRYSFFLTTGSSQTINYTATGLDCQPQYKLQVCTNQYTSLFVKATEQTEIQSVVPTSSNTYGLNLVTDTFDYTLVGNSGVSNKSVLNQTQATTAILLPIYFF